MKSKYWIFLLVIFMVLMMVEPSFAQCPMCKASAESSLKEGSTMALGLNKGILYLLAMPYTLFAVLFFLWYWNYRKNRVVAG